jgi:hypothetical protein
MKSDVIVVNSKGSAIESALNQVDAVAVYKKLSPKGSLQLHLLTEELIGMISSVTGETMGEYWIEEDDGLYQLHLRVLTRMSSHKREKLLSATTSGKNDAARGFFGRLRDLFDRDADSDVVAFTPLMAEGFYDSGSATAHDLEWSMSRYRDEVGIHREQKEIAAIDAWDELEKSVVAHVADEVKVFIRGDEVEMVIYKKLA